MLANWVKETTATTGTGSITLGGAPAGFIPFSAAFSDGRIVHYSIEDGDNREIGIGTYSAGTLSRDTILETLEGGVYTGQDGSPLAISLSGSATVSITGNAEHLITPSRMVGSTPANGIQDIVSGMASGTQTLVVDRLYIVPLYLFFPVLTDSIKITQVITAAVTGTKGRVGLYAVGSDTLPDRLIAEGSTDIDLTVTGYSVSSSFAAPIKISPGLYFIGLLTDTDAQIKSYATSYSQGSPIMAGYGMASYITNGHSFKIDVAAGWTAMPDNIAATPPTLSSDYNAWPILKLGGTIL